MIIYLTLLITLTFFYPRRERIVTTYEYHLIPFKNILAQIKDPQQYITPGYWFVFTRSIAGNFLLFFPLGFFLKFFTGKKNSIVFLYAVLVSIAIEFAQLVFHAGVCDIDDVILNSAGAFGGILFCGLIHKNSKAMSS